MNDVAAPAAPVAPVACLHGVGLSYGKAQALRDINLDIPAG